MGDWIALYPEVVTAGGFAAALDAAALEQGFTLALQPAGSRGEVHVRSIVPHRAELQISPSRRERSWWVCGAQHEQDREVMRGLGLIDGRTPDLAEVARAARAWQQGAPLEEIGRVAPSLRLTGRLEVPDLDPGGLVASEWQHLRTEAAGARPGYRALVEAAYAEPVLRQLYPMDTHGMLRWSACLERPCWPLPWATEWFAGYLVVSPGGVVVGEVATAPEAVVLVASWPAPGVGPARFGRPEEPVHDHLLDEARARLDRHLAAGHLWLRIEDATVEQWQAVLDRFRPGRHPWQYSEGGVEQDRPTAAQVFARPPGAPAATVRWAGPPATLHGLHTLAFHLRTPGEICVSLDLSEVAAELRGTVLRENLEEIADVLWPVRRSAAWALVGPPDDPTPADLALQGMSFARYRLLP